MLRRIGAVASSRSFRVAGTSGARRTQADTADRVVEAVIDKSLSMPAFASPVGTTLATIGAMGFAITIGWHIGKPVYDAYAGQSQDGDDDGDD